MDTIDEILACLRAWEPAVRVLGNVLTGEAIEAIERLRAEISTAEAFHKVAVAERNYERQRADILESATIKALEDRDRLRAELAECKRDAERYRWLRSESCPWPGVFSIEGADDYGWYAICEGDLDQAIDDALAAKEKVK